jgi:SPP1 family holin
MDKASMSRFALLIVAVINAGLNMAGYQTIPEGLVNDGILFLSGVYTVYMAWKNNYLSRKGQLQKKALQAQGLEKR